MKRSSMKSNIALQSRCRSEGRLFPRRKVATKSHLLNGVGDFDMELSLAIQESLKYAQEKEDQLRANGLCNANGSQSSDNENKRDNSSVQGNRTVQPRISDKAVYPAMAASGCEAEEVGRLKDLLLSQTELIQCQHEELAKKDKEIKSLQSANDALQCRLERMERRMSILKQKEEAHDTHGLAEENVMKLGASSHSQAAFQHKGQSEMSRMEFKKRRRGNKLNFSHRKSHKRQMVVKPSRGIQAQEEEEDESDNDDESSEESDSGEEENCQDEIDDSESHKGENGTADNDESPSEQEERTIDYLIMQTDNLYHLYYPKHHCINIDAKRLQEQAEVETPSWRLKPYANMYQLEGTENITDEAYNKRHQKFEMEEKRRKRWDLQMLRELRRSEKLQKQREDEMRASQDEVDVETFLPSIHDLKHIEITESLPVMAFGQPIPYVSPAEFEIPWEITSTGPTTSTGRQRSNSTYSKKH